MVAGITSESRPGSFRNSGRDHLGIRKPNQESRPFVWKADPDHIIAVARLRAPNVGINPPVEPPPAPKQGIATDLTSADFMSVKNWSC